MVENLTGKQFGLWAVLKRDEEKYNTRDVRWICRCECGTVKSVLGKYLKSGKSTSCGCGKKKDLTGQKFGKLTVLESLYNYDDYNRATYKCKCDCGNEVKVHSYVLTSGHTQSCGCLRSESVSKFEVFISDIFIRKSRYFL